MLKNIKSKYINEIIFSYVDEGPKLKLIKYNKSLQTNMNISIFNYKCFKGKYIIYKSKRFGREYDGGNDRLIFEGEYLNGERNGKGREYNEYGKIEYEGEYLNGKRHGKGKEYDDYSGNLLFVGEYINGQRNGKGKEYDKYNGKLIFEGEYLNGQRNGKGKEYYYNGGLL